MNSSKKLLYISGPPCGGKSTVSNELLKHISDYHYILGDEFWIQNDQYDFNERIEKTNQDILSYIENNTTNKILLEWVPSFGPFVDDLKRICEEKDFEFIHLILTAPKEILEERKLNRDGNMNLGPVDLEKYSTLKDVFIFDTSKVSLDYIVKELMSWRFG